MAWRRPGEDQRRRICDDRQAGGLELELKLAEELDIDIEARSRI